MEDFGFVRVEDRTQTQASTLLADWLEGPKTTKTASSIENFLSFTNIGTDKQESNKEKSESAGKDQADRLDKELRDFANAKLDDPSHSMLRFQKALGKFCNSADKDTAMDELSDTWSSLNSRMSIGAEALYKDRKDEIASEPGRKELDAAFKHKQDQFSDKLIDLPFEESTRIEDLTRWQDGETKAQHRDRIRQGLASDKPMLDAFNAMSAAEDNIEASKSPREKKLDHLIDQIKAESAVIEEQVEKAYVRSSL